MDKDFFMGLIDQTNFGVTPAGGYCHYTARCPSCGYKGHYTEIVWTNKFECENCGMHLRPWIWGPIRDGRIFDGTYLYPVLTVDVDIIERN